MDNTAMVNELKTRNLRLLLAEDDEFNRLYFEKIVSRFDCNIDLAEDGRIALEKCQSNTYDLVFLDLHMPHYDGIDVLRLTKNNNQSANVSTPFISISGTAVDDEITKINEAGFIDLLHKPFTPDSLIGLIHKAIQNTASKAPSTGTTVVTFDRLKALYGDDKEIIADLLGAIKTALPGYVKKIDEPDFYQDASSMKFLIHKIKPSFGYLGIDFQEFDLDKIEDELATGRIPDNIKEVCETLVSTAKKAITDIEHILAD